MINEDKVKELYHMALYDEYREKECKDMGRFFEKDYVSKEIMISFITGTIGFICLFVIWAFANLELVQEFMAQFNTVNLAFTFTVLGLLYLAFMIIYIFATIIYAHGKFKKGRKELKNYEKHLNGIQKMYVREEKLKS